MLDYAPELTPLNIAPVFHRKTRINMLRLNHILHLADIRKILICYSNCIFA